MKAFIGRPWYILGPGHRRPVVVPCPATREGAVRLGLVTLRQMVSALASAIAPDVFA
jgi:hypothetical protein